MGKYSVKDLLSLRTFLNLASKVNNYLPENLLVDYNLGDLENYLNEYLSMDPGVVGSGTVFAPVINDEYKRLINLQSNVGQILQDYETSLNLE